MNIDDLTLGQIKEINSMMPPTNYIASIESVTTNDGIHPPEGFVIVRTYSAGVWFGIIKEKLGKEIILTHARRMWKWKAKQGISLSEVSIYGVVEDYSKICEPVDGVYLEFIEIIKCTEKSKNSICGAKNATT